VGITARGRGVRRRLEDHMHEQLINALRDVPDAKRTKQLDSWRTWWVA
jgi:hypothetical protein